MSYKKYGEYKINSKSRFIFQIKQNLRRVTENEKFILIVYLLTPRAFDLQNHKKKEKQFINTYRIIIIFN